MKLLIPAVLAVTAASAHAQLPQRDYPSCDLPAQRAVVGRTGGSITDSAQAHISVRANVLQADIGNARKARVLTEQEAAGLFDRVERVRSDADRSTHGHGSLGTAERAAYDRELDAVATQVCGTRASAAQSGPEADDVYLLHRADMLNRWIDRAARQHTLTKARASALHTSVRRVQTFVGNQQARLGTIAPGDADRMNQQLTDVERALRHER